MKTIVINNPAAVMSGAVVILKQFITNISIHDNTNQYIIFVSLEDLKSYESTNIAIIVIPKQDFIKRILWDNWGFKKYLKANGILPTSIISLQNTGLSYDYSTPQFLYFHQGLSVTDEKCNPLDKEDRQFAFYKYFYPFFIKQHLKKIKKIIVQTDWVKKGFSKKFNYSESDIIVIPPTFDKPITVKGKKITDGVFRVFYPAGPSKYKNHLEIINAIKALEKDFPKAFEALVCTFTFDKKEGVKLWQYIQEHGLTEKFNLIGRTTYDETIEYYQKSDSLIFPSYIETFGLPLKEAASIGLPIIAIDKPYSRDVLYTYSNVTFVGFKDAHGWACALNECYLNQNRVNKIDTIIDDTDQSKWFDFFEFLK
ncbi:MAG: glycosyltransferase involved in cell wall biosynthesis [Psychroserpens sp.]|jgi:glycosyltransferase involved in cell wall biosynthesis